MLDYPIPVIGFCAFSGTGKTALLTQLITILKDKGLRVGVIKHAHHRFDIDTPGKDSYELRKAGAAQMLVASRKQMAFIKDFPNENDEPDFLEALSTLQTPMLDLVLVEGFKHESFPKIELHRPSLGKPLLYPEDSDFIAIATDEVLNDSDDHPHQLNLNNPLVIAEFIIRWIGA